MNKKHNYIDDLLLSKNELEEKNEIKTNAIEAFHEFTLKNYLKKKIFFSKDLSCLLFKQYSALFKSIITISGKNNFIKIDDEELLFGQIETLLKNSNSRIPLFVKSYAGYGKTEFLSILYLYLYFKFESKLSDKLPIYISLHYYNKFIYPTNRNFTQQAESKLEDDITSILLYLQNHTEQEVIIIIDGTDEFHNPKVDLDECIFQMINDLSIRGQIIGLRSYINKHSFTYRKEKQFLLEEIPEVEISLNRISVKSPHCQNFIEAFSKIESMSICNSYTSDTYSKYILDRIKKFNLKEIDYFHLFLFSKGLQNSVKYKNAKTLSSFYKRYLIECKINIQTAAELSFKIFNKPKEITNEEKNNRIWWKIQKHDSLRDFLTAYNIVEKLIEYTKNSNDVFNFVYPHELNIFCKEIINENIDNQKDAFRSIEELIKTAKLTAKTHFCYILGRFINEDVKKSAITLLKELEVSVYQEIKKRIPLDSTKTVKNEDKKYLLYHRTICISLICLGEENASSNYIELLLNNKYFDNLNRGFHLEYYEDINFSPASPDSLKHEDDLGSFDKTFMKLYSKLQDALTTNIYYPLFQIELYTICSLAQHRQAKGNLDEEKQKAIAEIVILTLNANCICPKLRTYLLFIKDRFAEQGKFKIASFIQELYSLKSLPRQGWVNRNIDHPETIASHIYGTLLLAYIHLPSNMEDEPGYDKKTIMRMLLIHDIGEAYIGDLPPQNKTSYMEKKEEQQLEYLNLIGTYEGLSSKLEFISLYKNFTHNKKDINCIIARELDKLDNLLQLYIYHKKSPVVDFEYFRNDLKGKISSKIGMQIMQQIEELYG